MAGTTESDAGRRVCVGEIAGAHGVRGLVRLRSFTEDPAAVASYGPLTDEAGQRRFVVQLQSPVKEAWIAQIDGISDRDAAEAVRGTRLYVERAALPATDEDEFYHTDLLGLRAERVGGDLLGTVTAVHDFGAGTMLEVRLVCGRTVAVPFTRAAVPAVDIPAGRLVVDPPAALIEPVGSSGSPGGGEQDGDGEPVPAESKR
jgi:16S rRNA processing protein RimM